LTAAQAERITAAAAASALPVGVWLERAALAVVGPTTLPGVRPGPPLFALERAAWLAGVQAMREAAVDLAFLARARPDRLLADPRAALPADLLAVCEEGLAATVRRAAAAPSVASRARASGLLPAPGNGPRTATARRVRVGFTPAEAVLIRASARVCGITPGRFVAAAADAFAAVADPPAEARHRARLAQAIHVLTRGREHWAAQVEHQLATGTAAPAGPPPQCLPDVLDELRAVLADAQRRWSWLPR
jgi:hypothetical protein